MSRDFVSAIQRAGVVGERAKREGRPLTPIEKGVIWGANFIANKMGLSPMMRNAIIREGETDKSLVLAKLKVKAVFAFYEEGDPTLNIPPKASYFILKSNHVNFDRGSNKDAEELREFGIDVPSTPTYEKWVRKGRPIFRGF